MFSQHDLGLMILAAVDCCCCIVLDSVAVVVGNILDSVDIVDIEHYSPEADIVDLWLVVDS